MKLLSLPIILALLFATILPALADDTICTLQENTVLRRLNFPGEPGFFAKVFPERMAAGFTVDSIPYAADLVTGNFYPMKGGYDVVPSPDDYFITTATYAGPLRWFRSADILDVAHDTDTTKANFWTPANYKMGYCYQSIGLLSGSTELHRPYRLLVDMDKGNFWIRNETFDFKTKNDPNPKYSEGPWTQLCTNIKGLLKLPMISKDGKLLSAYHVDTGKTEIYSIDDTGKCTLKKQLPFATAKADFSFDSSKIVFHHAGGGDPSSWFSRSELNDKINVYTLDLNNDKLTRISNQFEGNAYYPTFRKDGTVGFFEQTPSPAGKGASTYSYVLTDPSHGNPLSYPVNTSLEFSAGAALGALWMQVCHSTSNAITNNNLFFVAGALPANQCKAMVAKYWANYKAKIQKQLQTQQVQAETNKLTALAALNKPEKNYNVLSKIDIAQFGNAFPDPFGPFTAITPNMQSDIHRSGLVMAAVQQSAFLQDTLYSASELNTAIDELSVEAVAAACPKVDSSTAEENPISINADVHIKTQTPARLLQNTCSECHTGPNPPSGHSFDFTAPLSMLRDTREKMAARINAGDMPPSGGLNVEEQKELTAYLLSR